jgi:hypothetical protein
MKTFTTKEFMGLGGKSEMQIYMTDDYGTVWAVPQDPGNSHYQEYLAQLPKEGA